MKYSYLTVFRFHLINNLLNQLNIRMYEVHGILKRRDEIYFPHTKTKKSKSSI